MIASSGPPSRWSTVTGASSGTSALSLMSDSTRWLWTWATSSGPRSPAAPGREAVAVDQPGAELERVDAEAHPREVEEGEGRAHLDLDVARPPAARTRWSTDRSSTRGEPGTAYSTSPCSTAAASSASAMRRYTSSKVSAVS